MTTMIDAPSEPRCPTCDTLLVHAGAICVICDDKSHYEAPIITNPPIRSPSTPSTDVALDPQPRRDAS